MKLIAGWISDIINDFDGNRERVLGEVQKLCKNYLLYNN